MIKNFRLSLAVLLAALPACEVGIGGDGDASGGAIEVILAGRFAPLPAFAALAIGGRAQLVRQRGGTTRAQLQVTGLAVGTAHAAHVHALPCALGAGGHYKLDPTVEDTVDSNEIWPGFTTDANGVGVADVSVTHAARGDALSIVVHDPETGAKLACADLLADDEGEVTYEGTFAAFAAAESGDQAIGGTATMVRTASATDLAVEFSGLDVAATYGSHVHALPCGVAEAGGHYKIDPTIEDTIEDNELWPAIGEHADGTASAQLVNSAHGARGDAQSVVVHRVTADGAPKVACLDLLRESYPALVTEGAAVLLEAGAERTAELTASATMTRGLDGGTHVSISVAGAAAGTQYPVHVHNLPCGIQRGGGHYELDTSVADPIEDNELWLTFTADANGAGTAEDSVAHVARPEAQSLVIHDASDGERLACIDLN